MLVVFNKKFIFFTINNNMENKRQHNIENNIEFNKKPRIDIDNNINIDDNDLKIFNNYSQMTKRMAFYAGIWNVRKKKFTIPLNKAIEYGKKTPIAMEYEYIRMDNGHSARRLTLDVINELLDNNNIIVD